jgi:20S proteasome subunit alpha 6
LKKSPHDLASH